VPRFRGASPLKLAGPQWCYVRALVLAALLCLPSVVEAQGEVEVIYPATPGPELRKMWDDVVGCAGPYYVQGVTFDGILWFIREPVLTAAGDSILGEWRPGEVGADSIFITRGYESSGWVAAHEMLHHALHGPMDGDPHPKVPFMFPCGLNQFQQKSGGIMGGVELPNARWPAVNLYRREE
jgi:hypothetical protein